MQCDSETKLVSFTSVCYLGCFAVKKESTFLKEFGHSWVILFTFNSTFSFSWEWGRRGEI